MITLIAPGYLLACLAVAGWGYCALAAAARADDADQRAQQNLGEIGGVVGRGVHNGSSDK